MFKYINFLLLAILLLIFSCDEEPKPVIEGCTLKTACNYNPNATDDDGCGNDSKTCCEFEQGCNKWCNGVEGEPQELDCDGVCAGDVVEDECGACDNDPSNDCGSDCTIVEGDCNGNWVENEDCFSNSKCCWGGSKEVDECGVCGGTGIPDSQCDCAGNVEDCASECGGSAVVDECGVCDTDASNDNTPLTGNCDCNGDSIGGASIDGCGYCVGGDTGLTACANDCLGILNGDAVYDNCGEECITVNPEADCSEHCDNIPENNCVQDCDGEWGGSKEEDVCGVCGGTGIPFGECDCDGNVEDCNGDCGGSAVEDECGVCDTDASNDNTPLTGNCDCNGTPNGEAFINGCLDCAVEGNHPECDVDCADVYGGTNFVDNCSVCVPAGDTSCLLSCDSLWCNSSNCPQLVDDECGVCGGDGPEEHHDCDGICLEDLDCAEVCGGNLEIDNCEVCGGNDECIGCNDWYMGNFICDDIETTAKCCIEDEDNSDYRCRLASNDGTNCKVQEQGDENPFCQLEFEMECNTNPDTYNCDYDGVYIGEPCSSTEDTFTPGLGKCVKKCIGQNCLNIICDTNPTVNSCIYPGVAVGQPCSSTNNEFTVGAEGECMLYTDDDTYSTPQYLTYYNTGCEDGTDGCCSYTCDEPFTLSLEYIDASTLQVNYSSTVAIGGFQFDIDGAIVTGASGGNFDPSIIPTYLISLTGNNSLVVGYVFGGSFPAGSGILTNLNIDADGASTQLCLQNVTIGDPASNNINSCPEYWQLTCIPIP